MSGIFAPRMDRYSDTFLNSGNGCYHLPPRLDRYSDLNQADPNAKLFVGIKDADIAMVQEVLKDGADIEILCDGFSPLMVATSLGNLSMMQCLLNAGCDPNGRGLDDCTALHLAASNTSADPTRLLLAAGTDPTLITKMYGRPPSTLAEFHNNDAGPEIMQLLEDAKHGILPTRAEFGLDMPIRQAVVATPAPKQEDNEQRIRDKYKINTDAAKARGL